MQCTFHECAVLFPTSCANYTVKFSKVANGITNTPWYKFQNRPKALVFI